MSTSLRTFLLSATVLTAGCASDSDRSSIAQGAPQALCDLVTAQSREVPVGVLIRLEGRYSSDLATFENLSARCGNEVRVAMAFDYGLEESSPAFEPMQRALEKCRESGFCVIDADVTMDGIVESTPTGEFPFVFKAQRVVRFDLP